MDTADATQVMFGQLVQDLLTEFRGPGFTWQIVALAGCLIVAWLVARPVAARLKHAFESRGYALRFAMLSLQKSIFPLLGGALVLVARYALEWVMPVSVLRLVLVPLFGIAFLYGVFYVLRRVLAANGKLSPLLGFLEKVVTSLVWIGMILYVFGMLNEVVDWLQLVQFPIGTSKVSLASMLAGFVWILVTVLVAMWFGSYLEERVTGARSLDANLKVVLIRLSKAVLLLISILLSLSLVGIDLTVLSVFGGALGVGLGLGLQKIASNYVSGFILLLDRSLRIGDLITVDRFTGSVAQIRTRYTVVRHGDGETLVPNEQLVSQVVQNHSFSNTDVRVSVRVQAAYEAEPERVLAVLLSCTQDVPRVLLQPSPSAFLVSFGDSGIEYELSCSISDPQNGKLGVQSALNRAIWQRFRDEGIEIPFPQREIRVRGEEAIHVRLGAPDVEAPPRDSNPSAKAVE
jgi:small-conductance mechanosensitive channel